MSSLTNLVTTTAGAGAGRGIIECMRTLRLSGMHDAVDVLAREYDKIRASAQAEAAGYAADFVPLAHADIISEALR